jgi:uncharacterized membrane-anchored protein
MSVSNAESAGRLNQDIGGDPRREMLCKVPQVTVFFWIIKVLCTTVGETASDFLNVNLGLGLRGTAIAAGIVLSGVLLLQFRARKYVPALYWLAVVLISVFGTLVTDILTDSLGFPLEASTILFSVALGLTFAAWYAKERTLSIHSIFTTRREAFYWLAILFTFALGTAAGDLMAEKLGLGYLVTGLIVVGVIVAAAVARRFGLDRVLAFWIAYILTRPLGASIGDYLSQSKANGGLGLGATMTSVVFLVAIVAVVIFLGLTQRDFIADPAEEPAVEAKRGHAGWQVVAVTALLLVLGGVGYRVRRAHLHEQAAASVTAAAPLGDLTAFQGIAGDMLRLARAHDLSGASTRADDLEAAWDRGQAVMRPMNPAKWTLMDNAIDDVLRSVRATSQDAGAIDASLESLVHVMSTLGEQAAPTIAAPAAAPPVAATTAVPATPAADAAPRPLGDLSAFQRIADDLLRLVRGADVPGARARARDLEVAWDAAQARLQPMSPSRWTTMDAAIDDVLRKVRATPQDQGQTGASVEALSTVIHALDGPR